MVRRVTIFTDAEREALRQRLLAHKKRYQLSGQSISDQITDITGFAAADDGGRKRVDRFLNANHRQPHDFIAAIATYLEQVAPQSIEESAIGFARLLAQHYDEKADLSPLTGRYQAYLRPAPVRPPPSVLPFGTGTVIDLDRWARPDRYEIAYAIIAMTPLGRSNGLLIADTVTNAAIDPDIDTFPEKPFALSNTGVLVPFGLSAFLMVTRSLMETRLYRLVKMRDDPLTLRGHLTLNGLQNGLSKEKIRQVMWREREMFDPDYEVELIKVAETGED